MIFNIMLVSNQSGNITPRLPTYARHVVTLAELNFFESSSRQAEQESGIAKDKSSSTSPPHGLHGAGIPASPHGRFIKPASTASRPASAGPHYCFFKLVSITPTYFDISARPGASPSLHQPTPGIFASLADQLCHVSWTEGFASRAKLCQHCRVVVLSPIRQWVCVSSPNFGNHLPSDCYNK